MRPGADTKSPTSTMTEEMFREALELAHRVNRRITDTDLVRREAEPKVARAEEARR